MLATYLEEAVEAEDHAEAADIREELADYRRAIAAEENAEIMTATDAYIAAHDHPTAEENPMTTDLTTRIEALNPSSEVLKAAAHIEAAAPRLLAARAAGDNIASSEIHLEIRAAYRVIADESVEARAAADAWMDAFDEANPVVEETVHYRSETAAPTTTPSTPVTTQVTEALEAVEDLFDIYSEGTAPTAVITTDEAAQDVVYVTRVAAQAEAALEACGEAVNEAADAVREARGRLYAAQTDSEADAEDARITAAEAALEEVNEAYDRLHAAQDHIREIVSEVEDIYTEQQEEDARVAAAWAGLEAVREAYATARAESDISPEEWAGDVWPAFDIRSVESDDWADAIYPRSDRSAADYQVYLSRDGAEGFWAIARRAEHNLTAMGYGERGFDPTSLIEEIY